jgi:uncharacterized membrane protein
VALATAKGGKAHRAWGKVYFWAMAGVAATALTLSILLPILFLALVAVFSFYASFQAYRVLSQKDMARAQRVSWYDWGAAGFTFAASLALALLGVFRPALVNNMGIVSVVFGILGMRLSWRALMLFRNPPQEKMFWWYEHMQGMIASYIAACTAFSSVNLGHFFGNAWWVWLWPSMIGVPAIFWWTRKYKKKFAPRVKVQPV